MSTRRTSSPADLGGLGLDDEALQSHIAWDPGALAVAAEMAAVLDAPLVAPRMSRLVYDCNRPLEAPSAVPEVSEAYDIPGNAGLSLADRKARADRVYTPFRDALNAILEERMDEGRRPRAGVGPFLHACLPRGRAKHGAGHPA